VRSLPSSRHLAISPLRWDIHTTTPSSSPHRPALSLTRAPHPPLLWACAPHPPLFCPPPLQLTLRPRPASAPFFAPLSPPIRTPCKSRCTQVCFSPPCVPRASPPPPRPLPRCSLFSFLLLEASAGIRCRPPRACGGAPGAVLVCFADLCVILITMRQR